ncbi:hypothetical protein [Kitasatospora cathayae]|uniref:YcxB-like protein domain-containing protein n=1 Tax=Kitasatospora cathayae TaxID=3004092 RepID=A0ABY7QDB7_9ACTN|nr:hypothetical protein [Kitasatospora sp. HUAS 3-15]WBP90685.1 hypothetical protein O1G21_35665 [Kitasatospora sp. HUAS 3-15]
MELRFTPTAGDFRAAFAARARGTVAGRGARRWTNLLAGCATFTGAGGALTAAANGVARPPAVLMFFFALLVLARPWLRAWQARRLAADKGEFRVLVDEAGVTVTNAVSSTVLDWRELPYYLETPEQFVLLGGNEQTHTLTVLPKRGTDEPGRLGELIAWRSSALPQG